MPYFPKSPEEPFFQPLRSPFLRPPSHRSSLPHLFFDTTVTSLQPDTIPTLFVRSLY